MKKRSSRESNRVVSVVEQVEDIFDEIKKGPPEKQMNIVRIQQEAILNARKSETLLYMNWIIYDLWKAVSDKLWLIGL
jgi:RNA polymerase-interacting CarD/CdnL/TRCF family regulator